MSTGSLGLAFFINIEELAKREGIVDWIGVGHPDFEQMVDIGITEKLGSSAGTSFFLYIGYETGESCR